MTTKYKTKAFVYRKSDRNEADRLFSVFTDDFGKIDISAKAIRKSTSKLRSGIGIFCLSEIEFIQGKNKKTLTDAIMIERFDNITQDLEKFNIANNIGEVLNNFIKGEVKDEEIFNLLKDVFSRLNNHSLKKTKYFLIYQYFLWNFISFQGYKSEVNNCATCQSKLHPSRVYFSGKEGGVVCDKCFTGDEEFQEINSDAVKVLRIILKKDWETLLKLKVEQASQRLLSIVSERAVASCCPS